jgi:hypothetical protein
MFSGLPPTSDIRRRGWHDRFVPYRKSGRPHSIISFGALAGCASNAGKRSKRILAMDLVMQGPGEPQ